MWLALLCREYRSSDHTHSKGHWQFSATQEMTCGLEQDCWLAQEEKCVAQ